MAQLTALAKILGVSFKDLSHLEHALVHSSYVNENPGLGMDSNERLEFLGDAVLGLVAAELLYEKFPGLAEGQMTRFRAALVRREALAALARSVKLGDFLLLGKGEEAGGGRRRPANLAGAMEAVIAAIYLDRGLEAARDFVLKRLTPELAEITSRGDTVDYKSDLQEYLQAREGQRPEYVLVGTSGPDHAPRFTVEVKLGDLVLGQGTGSSKKAAESEAARVAMGKINGDSSLRSE